MRQQKNKLICKCGTKGGVLTLRQAGNSKTKSSLYIQHHDPTKKAGKRPCYISRQNVSLIRLADRRYKREYIPLIKYFFNSRQNQLLSRDQLLSIIERCEQLLIEMGWPNRVLRAYEKFGADVDEIHVLDTVKRYKNELGKEVTRELVFKKHFKRKRVRFKLEKEEKKRWEKVAESGRELLRSDQNKS